MAELPLSLAQELDLKILGGGVRPRYPRVGANITKIPAGHALVAPWRAGSLSRLPFVCHGHRAEASSNQADEFSPQILDHESGQLVSPSNYSLTQLALFSAALE